MDLTGPFNVLTWDGKHYALVVVEVSKHLSAGTLLENKEEVYSAIHDNIFWYKWEGGKLIKIIKTDNGIEFINSVMQEFYKQNGIQHQTTNPYRP